MKRLELNDTYAYENFITDEEQTVLLNWINENKNLFKVNTTQSNKINAPYGSRKTLKLREIEYGPHTLIKNLKDRIIDIEKITDWIEEPVIGDAIGINENGGAIHPHSDPNLEGYTHVRYNIILSYPIEGGHSIYNGKINELKEKMIWRCVAGKVIHGSLSVVGDKPRITLSLGFQIKNIFKNKKSLI